MTKKISIIIFLFLYLPVLSADDIKVVSSDKNSIIIEYSQIISDSTSITINNVEYKKINLYNGVPDSDLQYGDPDVQVRKVNIGVPSEVGNTIQILSSSTKRISGRLSPIPTPVLIDGTNSFEYKISESYNDYNNKELPVSLGEYNNVRNLGIQTVTINPVQFDASTNKIKLYYKITFKVTFASANQKVTLNDNFLERAVLNYDIAKNWGTRSRGLAKVNFESSVLATGTWYRFKAPTEGIYKITRDDLSSLGIDADNVDPRTIKIYNNGGYILPEDPEIEVPDNLVENAIYIAGEGDGSFDNSDYILFYGRGTDFYEYDSDEDEVVRMKHYYTKDNYYWITSGGDEGKRMETKNSSSSSTGYVQDYTEAFTFHEQDLLQLSEVLSGRRYFGESFNSNNKTVSIVNSLNNRISGSRIEYHFSFINSAERRVRLTITENDNSLYSSSLSYPNHTTDYEYGEETESTVSYSGDLTDDRSVVKFSFDASLSTDIGYLDYLEIKYERELYAANDTIVFFSKDTGAVIEYNLYDFSTSSIEVYDITDFSSVKKIENATISGGQFIFKAQEQFNAVSKYMGLNTNSYKSIEDAEQVDNTNIKGILEGSEYILVTTRDFSEHAERLETYRESQSPNKYSVQIVYIDQIFNEFNSGLYDPMAVRNFVKYAFENWNTQPYFFVLFGDSEYDFLNREGGEYNFLPTYQSEESLDEVDSYTTDEMFVRVTQDSKPDLCYARIPVYNDESAKIIIDKIIAYEANADKGIWQNQITLVADDRMKSTSQEDNLHTPQSEVLDSSYIPKHFNVNKIYLAKYPTVVTGLGRRKPEVNIAIIEAVNDGTILLNYIGHGSSKEWADERVLLRDVTIPQFENENYFFLTAATCEFGQFDLVGVQSGAEVMLFLENGGAIGEFVSARPVFSSNNARLNNIFYSNLISEANTIGDPITTGEAFFLTKLTGSNSPSNDRKFHLLGDPAVCLAVPEPLVKIDSVNGKSLEESVQIAALSTVKINGSVTDSQSNVNTSFNGEGIVTVFDSDITVSLEELGEGYTIKDQGGIIFNGGVTVENGKFQTEFVVPKDISYTNLNGKITSLLFDESSDFVGATENVIIGGTDSSVVDDNTGPEVEIFYDDISYENSYLVNSDFKLIVKLSDETGLNTTGTGIGHNLEGILNDEDTDPIDFTNSYAGDLNSGGKSGVIEHSFLNMEAGDYELKVKAWDVFNNLTEEESSFTVVNSDGLVIRNVVNYPNPFSSNTTFTFQQNLESSLNVRIKIYTIAGRLIKEINSDNIVDKFVKIDWDGRDEDGDVLANGTYLYNLIVESADGEFKENILGKLAVIK
ncbi:MAG: type IX secretion system sortase PorU [Ignavibacteria bacterium]|jgi:hypothetical protein